MQRRIVSLLLFILTFIFPATSGFVYSQSPLFFKNSTFEIAYMGDILSQWSLGAKTSYYIVQCKDPSVRVRHGLEKIATLVRYVPDHAYIVKSNNDPTVIQDLPGVSSVIPYAPFLKVEKSLFKEASKELLTIVIHFFPTENVIRDKLSSPVLDVIDVSNQTALVSISRDDLFEIASIDGVEWIEKNGDIVLPVLTVPRLSDDKKGENSFQALNGYGSGAKILNPQKLYDSGIRGEHETIAFLDSGLDKGNSEQLPLDLAGRLKEAVSVGRPDSKNWDDPLGHGTHVAGLIAGNGAKSGGEIRGMAFESDLIVQSAFVWSFRQGQPVKGIKLSANIGSHFQYAYDHGARVHSNSWHSMGLGSYGILTHNVDEFTWSHPDMAIVFAAGNEGVDLDKDGVIDGSSIFQPANCKNCITVGASENIIKTGGFQESWGVLGKIGKKNRWETDPIASDLPSNNSQGIAAFSSRGPTEDGRIKPDVVAPGTNNISLRSRAQTASVKETWGVFNDDYVFMGGSSMAAPLVAGAAALIRQFYRDVEKRDFISAALVKATLINGAKDLYPGQFEKFSEISTKRPNGHEGFGRVDLENSLFPQKPRVRKSVDYRNGLSENQSLEYIVKVTGTESLSITLVYNDFPSSPAVQKMLVNDLDIILETSDGTKIYPNGLKGPDHLNNVEQIDIEHPMVGNYRLAVKASSVHFGVGDPGKQPFALVISGAFKLLSEV